MQPAIDRAPRSNTLAMLCHVLAFAGYVIPFGNIVGPLVLWLVKKNDDPMVDHHGKESVNFQITVSLMHLALVFLIFGLMALPGILEFLLVLMLIMAVAVFQLVFVIIAAIKANRGELYRYPLTLRLVR